MGNPAHTFQPGGGRRASWEKSLTPARFVIIIQGVNNFYSAPEIFYPRWLTASLQQAVQDHPVVVLTGARQVGKSTLLLNAEPFKSWRFLSLDDFDTLRQASQEPQALWAGTEQVVLDEVQRAPDLLLAVKQAVDRHPGRYRFVLSGSANLLLMRQVSESLAGRAVYFVLDPLSLGETRQAPPPDLVQRLLAGEWPAEGMVKAEQADLVPLMLRGLMPALLSMPSPQAWVRWWDGYVATYLERDLRQVSQIEALLDFRRLMELAALRSGQLLNQSELGRDAQLSQATAHRYLNLLETTHMFERLPAYTASHTTRLLKSPKAFWNDTGLAIFLSGYYEEADLRKARELGAYFETSHLSPSAHFDAPDDPGRAALFLAGAQRSGGRFCTRAWPAAPGNRGQARREPWIWGCGGAAPLPGGISPSGGAAAAYRGGGAPVG